MDYIIDPLHQSFHNRNLFDCGIVELNAFIKRYANQNQLKNISRTYVAISKNELSVPKTIFGYYTLSAGQINFDQLPQAFMAKLPKHPVPIARIARLAVDKKYQGQGLGGYLLYHALMNILTIAEKIGTFAIVVDAKNHDAKIFYQKFNFIELQESALTLFLPIETIKHAAVPGEKTQLLASAL